MKSSNTSIVRGEGDYASAKKYDTASRGTQEREAVRKAEAEGRAKRRPNAGQDSGSPPARPKPEKHAPGKHPEGYNPAPRKVPGR